jgi:hypothetical protein
MSARREPSDGTGVSRCCRIKPSEVVAVKGTVPESSSKRTMPSA